MGLADVYYNLEDKWYDLLDFLESKRIPVYKVVDPVENAGVPTLPVFVALLLLAGYFLFSGLGAPAAPSGVEVTVEVYSGTNLQPGATVGALVDSASVASGTTDQEGKIRFTVPAGTVTFVVDKAGCNRTTENFTVSKTDTFKVYIGCQAAAVAEFQSIVILDQHGNRRSGTALLMDADKRVVATYPVVGGELNISKGIMFDTLRLQSDCETVEKSRADLLLSPVIRIDCKTGADETRLAQTASLTVYAYSGSDKVSNVPVYLEDEGGNAFTEHQLTAAGSTVFSVDKNRVFRIRTDATSLYEAYSSEKMSVSGDSSKDISLVKGLVFSTINVSDNVTKKPVSGARVTITYAGDEDVEKVMTGPSETFSLKSREYTLVLFRDGYMRSVGKLTGGKNATFYMQPLDKAKTGSLSVFVYGEESGSGLQGISVNVFDEGGVPLGMSASATDGNGLAFFSGIQEMRVKPVASKGGDGYKPSPDAVEIKAGQTALANIPIPFKQFNLSVSVVNASGAFVSGADVYLYDYKNALVSSARSDIRGRANFTITESKKYYVVAERYDADAKTYQRTTTETFTVVSSMDKTLTLRPIEANAAFTGFYLDPNLQNNVTGGNVLTAGGTYYAAFAVGLFGEYNETVFEISSDDRYVMFPPYGDITSGTNVPKVENKSNKITITWKGFTPSTETLKIRVYAKAEAANAELSYKVTWKRGDKTATRDGKVVLNVTAPETKVTCESKDGICFSRTMDSRELKLNQDFTVKFVMNYEGYELKDALQAEGSKHVKFTGIALSKNYAYSLGDREINVTGIRNNITAGEKLEGNITAKAVELGTVKDASKPQIDFRIGSTSFPIDFNVTGTHTLDFTTSKSSVPCTADKTPVEVTVTYDGSAYKGAKVETSKDSDTSGSNGKATVDVGSDGKIKVSADGADPKEKTLGVSNCPGAIIKVDPKSIDFSAIGKDKGQDVTVTIGNDKDSGVTINAKVGASVPTGFTASPTSSESVKLEPGDSKEVKITVTAKADEASGAMTIRMTYGYSDTPTDSVQLKIAVPKPPTPPVALAGPSAAAKVLDEETYRTNLSSVGTVQAMMDKNYTGSRHALDAIYRILNFTNGTIPINSPATKATQWVALNMVRVRSLQPTDIKNYLCSMRGKSIKPTDTNFCGDRVNVDAVSSRVLNCGRHNVTVEVDSTGSTTTGDYKWSVKKIETLSGKCAFENASQFAGFLDNVNISTEGEDPILVREATSSMLSKIWGFANCNLQPPSFAPQADNKCVINDKTKFAAAGNYLIIRRCGATSEADALRDCNAVDGVEKLDAAIKSVNWTIYSGGSHQVLAAAAVNVRDSSNRVVVFFKPASYASDALDALYGFYNSTPTALVFEDANRKVLYVSSAAVTLEKVYIPPSKDIVAGVPFNVSMVYRSSRGYNGTVWIFWNTSDVQYVANYTKTLDSSDTGYLSSGTGTAKDGAGKDFYYFYASVNASTNVTLSLVANKQVPFEIRYRAAENNRSVSCTGGSTDYLRYPSGGTCTDKCNPDTNANSPECAYAGPEVRGPGGGVPKGKTLVDLLMVLNTSCTFSKENAPASNEYGTTGWISKDPNGRPAVLEWPAKVSWSKGVLYSADGSECEREVAIEALNYTVWDYTRRGYPRPLYFTNDSGVCKNRVSLVYVGDIYSLREWELTINNNTPYDSFAMQWYGPEGGAGWQNCVVRVTKRPSMAAELPLIVSANAENQFNFTYTAGFRSNARAYIYVNNSLGFVSSNIADTVKTDLGNGEYLLNISITGISGDSGSQKIIITLKPTATGSFTIRYRASDNAWRLRDPSDPASTDGGRLRFPKAGELTSDCALENASCATSPLMFNVLG